MPSYNHAAFVREAVESVLDQTFQDWELLISDDCSADDSFSILKGYAQAKIVVERNPQNLGTYGTLARLRAKASGDLVAVLNSDDRWSSDKLAKQVALLDAHPAAAFCYTLGGRIDEKGEPITGDDHADWPRAEVQELLPHLLEENRILASSVVFRRQFLQFFPELRYSGDWVALLRAAREGPGACVPEPLSHWRMHSSNSFVRSKPQVAEETRIRESILRHFEFWMINRVDRRSIRQGLGRCAIHLSALLVLQGRMAEARRVALSGVKRDPGRRSLKRLATVALPSTSAYRRLWGSDPAILFDEPGSAFDLTR